MNYLENFQLKSIEIYGDIFDFSETNYINSKTKISFKCKKCNQFLSRTPNYHISKKISCPNCSKLENHSGIKLSNSEAIQNLKNVHFDLYDYSKVNYINYKTKIEIICKKHGSFLQFYSQHLKGQGCPICGVEKSVKSRSLTQQKFLDKVADNNYDYSKAVYINADTKIEIICPIHGSFFQTPNNHLTKNQGCPKCASSKGEKLIANFLTEHKIDFIQQKRFSDCKDKNTLPFDFYLPNNNLLIEFDGRQHFEIIETFGGIEYFNQVVYHDKIKDEFALKNGIKLIRIKFNENIQEKLNSLLDVYF